MSNDSLPDRLHHTIQKLMGVRKRIDPRTADGPVFATFQDRIFASMMDVGILFLLFNDLFRWISSLVYRGIDQQMATAMPESLAHAPIRRQVEFFVGQLIDTGFAQLWVVNSLIHSIIIGVLLVAVWAHFHTTPGKFIIGMRIAGKNGEGSPDLRTCVIRYLGFYLSMPIFMIGYALLGIDKQKRAWHDRIAGTTVIYTREGSIFRRAWDLLRNQLRRNP